MEDDESLAQWYPTVIGNSLRPTLPDVAGPSDAQAHFHFSGIQYDIQPFEDTTVRGNGHIPTGTRERDYIHSAPQFDSGYPLDYTPTSLELGYHNYRPIQQHAFHNLAGNLIEGNDFQYIPEPEPEPEMVEGDYALQNQFVNFHHMHSLTNSDATTLVPTTSYSQTIRQSTLQDLDLMVEDHTDGDAVDYLHDINDPTALLNRQQFDLAAKSLETSHYPIDVAMPILSGMLVDDTTRSQFVEKTLVTESASSSFEDHDESERSLHHTGTMYSAGGYTGPGQRFDYCWPWKLGESVFQLLARPCTSKSRCVRCRIMKIKCKDGKTLGGPCGPCSSFPYDCCIMPEHLFPPFPTPDLYTDLDVTTIECLGSSGTVPLSRKADIFLCSRMDKRNVFLPCEVNVYRLKFSDPLYLALTETGLWEDMRSPGTQKHFGLDQTLSCSLIPASLPSKQKIHDWILESAGTNPSGAIGGLQGPIYKCAKSYIKNAFMPLHELVASALIHTSLYNLCHSKLSIVLANQHNTAFRVCPKLRTQLLDPLFLQTGCELQVKLKIAAMEFDHSLKEQHLPLCLVMWMLMLMYLHCDVQTEKAISIFPSIDSVSLGVVRKKNSRFAPDLQTRQENTKASIDTIKVLHRALFWRTGKPIGPILDTKFKVKCNNCVDENTQTCHNELEKEISSLRRAVWLQQTDSRPWPDGPSHHMNEIMGYLPRNYEYLDPESSSDHEDLMIAPLPSEDTLSTSKRLDYDAMSVDTQLGAGHINPAASISQEYVERLNEKANETNKWDLIGIRS